jgi:hypothetical protein
VEEKPAWLGGRNVLLTDASGVRNLRGRHYRLHYSADLFSLTMKVLDITGEEKEETPRNFGKPGMEHARESGSNFLLRLRGGAFNVYDGSGRKRSIMRQFSVTCWTY